MTEDLEHALELRYTNFVKEAFIKAIRASFAHEATPARYRYHLTEQGKRQISIARGWSKKVEKYPIIIVETEPGDFSISTLDQEEAFALVDNEGVQTDIVYAGVMTIPVRLTVMAKTALDREKLTDLLSIYVRFVFRDKFYKSNIPYLEITAGEDGEEVIDNEVFYKGSVRVRCQTEFQQKVDLTLLDAVNAIDIAGILMGTSAADLQPNEG